MSIVLSIATQNGIIMMSDSRLIKFKSDKTIEKIESEHFDKIFQLNKNVAIGFGGNANNAELIKNHLLTYQNINLFSFEDIKRKAINYARKLDYSFDGLDILLSGINRNNKYEILELKSKDNFEVNSYVQNANEVYIANLKPQTLSKNIYVEIRKEYIDTKVPSFTNVTEIEEAMREFIFRIATEDESVNKVIKLIRINKESTYA